MANLRVPVLGPRAIVTSSGELQLPSPPYFVNFSAKLSTMIRESKCLDKMGFVVPEVAANVALQEEKYSLYIMQLKGMLQRYETVYSSLLPVERYLLKQQLEKLQIAIKPGFDRLNWNSLHLLTFINDCNKAIQAFSSNPDTQRSQQHRKYHTDITETALVDTSIFDGRVIT